MSCILLYWGLFAFFCKGPDGGGGGIFFNKYNTLDELYSLYWVFFCIFFVKALTAAAMAFFLLSITDITP
jgi:hypothetical protein